MTDGPGGGDPPPGGYGPPPPGGYGGPPPPGGYGGPPPPGGYGGPPPPGGYGGPPPPPGGYGYQYPPRRTDGNAIAALVLAILSFVVCPVIPAIVALFLANSAKANIEASGGALEGQSLVSAARVIAWINLGLAGLSVLAFLTFVVLGGLVGLST